MKILSQKAQAASVLLDALRPTHHPLSLLRNAGRDDGDAAILAGIADSLLSAERLLRQLQDRYQRRITALRTELYNTKDGVAQAAIANVYTKKSIRLVVALPDARCDSPHISASTIEAAMRTLGVAQPRDLITLAGYDIAATDPHGNVQFTIKSIYSP